MIWEAVNYACEEVVGRRKLEQKGLLSVETYRKIQEKKVKKATINRRTKKEAQKQHTETKSKLKRNIRTDKRNFMDRIAQEVEEAAASGNIKQLYDITRTSRESLDQQNFRSKIGTKLS